MLRVIVQANAAAAQSYYQGSTGGEYYAEGQEQAGEWGGEAAKRLGLEGSVEKAAFDALCENRDPETGEWITPRTKTVRRVGFDLNFHVPKSVSIVYGLTGDRFTLEELRTIWKARLSSSERTALNAVVAREVPVAVRDPHAARDAMTFATAHSFERSSVIPVKRLLGVALRHGVGQVTLEEIHDELKQYRLIVRDYDGERLATTRDVLAEETRILQFARKGRNSCRSLVNEDRPLPDWLSPSQQSAIRHVLNTPDRVILVRGVAGSGKTTLIKICVDEIQAKGKSVLLLAPSAEASRGVLHKEGFASADTVAKFLLDERLQDWFETHCFRFGGRGSRGAINRFGPSLKRESPDSIRRSARVSNTSRGRDDDRTTIHKRTATAPAGEPDRRCARRVRGVRRGELLRGSDRHASLSILRRYLACLPVLRPRNHVVRSGARNRKL